MRKARSEWAETLVGVLAIAVVVIVPSCGGNGNHRATSSGAVSSMNPSVSGDGSRVAFDSTSSNLASSGASSGGARQIFVFDRASGTSKAISPAQGATPDGDSSDPVLSLDGQWVAFQSRATNLAGTTPGNTTSTTSATTSTSSATTMTTTMGTTMTTMASTTSTTFSSGTSVGTTTGSTTGATGSTPRLQIFVANVGTGQMQLVSTTPGGIVGNGDSMNPSISSDGQRVAFDSNSSTTVTGGPATTLTGPSNVFVWTMATGKVELVSVDTSGGAAGAGSTNPSISADGRFVAFQSAAANLVAGMTGGRIGIFVRDLTTGTTLAVTPDQSGAGGDSLNPSISGDGRFVAFESTANNLISGSSASTSARSNVFVWDRTTGQIQQASVPSGSSPSNSPGGDSHHPSISSDGRFVAFDSQSGNLTSMTGAASAASNVFVRDLQAGTTMLLSVAQAGSTTSGTTASTGAGGSTNPSISQDGTWVAFMSDAAGLTSDAGSGTLNVFLANRVTGAILLVSREVAGGTTTTGTTTGTTSVSTTTGTTTGSTSAATTATTFGTATSVGTTTGATTGTMGTTLGTTSAATTATTFGTGTSVGTATGTTTGTTSAATTATTFSTGTSVGTTGATTGASATTAATMGTSTGTTFSTFGTTGTTFGTTGTTLGPTGTTFSTFGTTGTTFGTTGTTLGTTATTTGTTGTSFGTTGATTQ